MENCIDISFDQDNEDKTSKRIKNEEGSVELKHTIQNFSSTLPIKTLKEYERKKVFSDENKSKEMKRKQHIPSQLNTDFEPQRMKKSNFSTHNFDLRKNENENNQQKTKNKKIQPQFSKKTQKEYKFSNGRDIQLERQIEGVKKQINNNVFALQKLMEDKITKSANKQKMNESFSNIISLNAKSKNVDYSSNKQKVISRTINDKKPKESNQKIKNKMEIDLKKQQSGKILAKSIDKKTINNVDKLKNKNELNINDKESRKKQKNNDEKVNQLELRDTKKKINSLKQKKTKSKNEKIIVRTEDDKDKCFQKTMIGLIEKAQLYYQSKGESEYNVINKGIQVEKDTDNCFQNFVDVSQEYKIDSFQEEAKKSDIFQRTQNDLIKRVEDLINKQNMQQDSNQSKSSSTISKCDECTSNFYRKTMIGLIEKIDCYINSKMISDEQVHEKQLEQIEESQKQIEDQEKEIKNENEFTESVAKSMLDNEEEIQTLHINKLNIEIKPLQNEKQLQQLNNNRNQHINEDLCQVNKILQNNNEMNENETKINDLTNQIEQMQEKISNQDIKSNEKDDETLEFIQNEYTKLQEEKQVLENNNEDLCQVNKILQNNNEMNENETKINDLTNQIEQIQVQISNQDMKSNEKDDETLECIQNEYTKLQEEKQVLEHNNEKLQEHNLSLQYTNEELQQQIQSLAVKKQENETTIDILRKEIESLQEKLLNKKKENNNYQILGNNRIEDNQSESSKLYTDSPDELESNNFYSSDELNSNYCYNENDEFDLTDFKQNSDLYLRCLVKFSDEHPIRYDEIPKEFSDFFSIIGVSQALNISIENPLPKDLAKIENYIDENQHKFTKFSEVAEGIRNNFQSDIEKMYASFYFVTHHIEYDIQKKLSANREDSSIEKIFDTKKGVCSDYSKLFIEMMKRSGISSKKLPMVYYVNASKSSNWNSFRPLSYPYFNHAAVLIKINNEYYISEPTWGAGITTKDDEYQVNYRKSYFLIPYFKGVLSHYPKYANEETLQIPFSWDQFASLNNPNISKELAFESNPFQKITVNDGFYDFQFSFVQPVDSLSAKIYLLNENTWQEQRENLISFECIEKNLPNHCFSFYPSELRCRYKMRASFIETGSYRVEAYLNLKLLFIVYFDVKSIGNIKFGIPGCFKEKNGFEPIVPTDGLTRVTNGYARIRFAVKYKNSKTLIALYKIKENTFTRERKYENECIDSFTAKLPFINYDERESNDDLVENWILINFPENGRWEVEVYFQTEKLLMYQYGVKYYFDVEGSGKYNISPLFDFPKNRKFAAFDMNTSMNVSINPQTNAVVLNDYDYNFHVLSEENVNVYIKSDKKSNSEYSSDFISLFSEMKNDETNLTDYEYSITFPKSDKYNLIVVHDGQIIGSQNIYVIDEELPDETEKERLLMENLKNKLDGKIDYFNDIPISIRKNVERMLSIE